MFEEFNCALVRVVEGIINSNLATMRWYTAYQQLFANNTKNNKYVH